MTIAFRNAATTPLTSGVTSTSIPIPSGVQAGDLLITWVEIGSIVSAFNNPAGWTQFSWSPVIDGVNSNAWAFWKIAAAGESPAAISWTTTSKGVLVTVAYSGVDVVNPLGANNVQIETTTQTTATTPSLAAVVNEWAVTIHSSRTSTTANKSPTWTAPSGEIQENATDNGAAAAAPWSAVVAFDSNGLVTIGSHSYTATSNFSEGHHKSALVYINAAVPTARPLVVGPQPSSVRASVSPPVVVRSSLQDAAVAAAATPAPTVVTVSGLPVPVRRPAMVRGSLADFATPVTPSPVVVTVAGAPVKVPRPALVRGSVQDFATPATPQPYVVSPAFPVPGLPARAVTSRTSLTDPAGVQPVVVSVPGTLADLPSRPVTSRSSLFDVPVATPAPLVVPAVLVAPAWVPAPYVSRNPSANVPAPPVSAGSMASATAAAGMASGAASGGVSSAPTAAAMSSAAGAASLTSQTSEARMVSSG